MVRRHHKAKRSGESGQTIVLIVVVIALFLVAALGFGIDLTNMWFHRQMAQTAADAACQAGAMDMLLTINGKKLPKMGFTLGTASDCESSPSATMCSYAEFNGYSGDGLRPDASSSEVSWTFPSTVPGAQAPSSAITPYPYMHVVVAENVRAYFTPVITGRSYQKVAAHCTCGLAMVKQSAPLVVLHPDMEGALLYSGGAVLQFFGGPQRSVMVNSTNPKGLKRMPDGVIDTTMGNRDHTGSDVATGGGMTETAVQTQSGKKGFNKGATSTWYTNASLVSDPFGGVPPPELMKLVEPSTKSGKQYYRTVPHGVDGCPDGNSHWPVGADCKEFAPGYYPSGISLGGVDTAIFLPGVYYLEGNLNVGASATVRMAKPPGFQQTDGVMFYFLNGSLIINGASGQPRSGIDPVSSSDLTCDGSQPDSALGLPAQLNGNVLWAQCTANATYYDSTGESGDAMGTLTSPGSRGLLVFQAHTNASTGAFGGSGALAFSGSLYFHENAYKSKLTVSGGSGIGTYMLGNIVADQLEVNGSGVIKMALNPANSVLMMKAAMLQ